MTKESTRYTIYEYEEAFNSIVNDMRQWSEGNAFFEVEDVLEDVKNFLEAKMPWVVELKDRIQRERSE